MYIIETTSDLLWNLNFEQEKDLMPSCTNWELEKELKELNQMTEQEIIDSYKVDTIEEAKELINEWYN